MKIAFISGSIMQHLGPFKFPMVFILILVLIVILLLVIDTFVKGKSNPERRKQSLNALLVLGSMNAAIGMLGQIMGIWYALAAILQAEDISPAIVIEGLQASFGTTYFGLITFFIAIVAWLIFNYLPMLRSTS